MTEISDAALDSYYAKRFKYAYGYDPLEGPYGYEDEDEDEEEDEDG